MKRGSDMITRIPMLKNLQERRLFWCKILLCAAVSSLTGILFVTVAGNPYMTLMRLVVSRRVSIVGSAVAILVPYLVSFLVVYSSKTRWAFVLFGLRIFTFTAIGRGMQTAFGSACWLIRFFAQFPDLCLIPLTVFFMLSAVNKDRSRRHLMLCLCITALVCILNYCIISPFLANLIETYETTGRYATHVGLDWRL